MLCSSENILDIADSSKMKYVTSDCRPWPVSGHVVCCRDCFAVQKLIDEKYLKTCKDLYDSYEVYYQAQGQEQAVFDQQSGAALTRSARILDDIMKNIQLEKNGRILDFGCGNGTFLRVFSERFPLWQIAGAELDERNKNDIRMIKESAEFFTCDLDEIPGTFDVISLIHAFEHINTPAVLLDKIKKKLRPDGLLLIEIPDYTQNPFDLIIMDHCFHYSQKALKNLICKNGFKCVYSTINAVPKEVTSLFSFGTSLDMTGDPGSLNVLEKSFRWLNDFIEKAKDISSEKQIGIFGTSIAATWLYSNIPEKIAFFVDEDPNKVNKTFLGKPVYYPADVPGNENVYISLPYNIACRIYDRVGRYKAKFHLPPEFI